MGLRGYPEPLHSYEPLRRCPHMDFLATIIERKKQGHDRPIEVVRRLLDDIIKYEKLARVEKFRDLNNPVVQKQCPNLAKVLDTNTFEYVIMIDLLPLLVDFTGRAIGTITLLEQNKRERIMNNIFGFQLHIYDTTMLANNIPKEFIAVSEEVDGLNKVMVITESRGHINVYVGHTSGGVIISDATTQYKPVKVTSGQDSIIITSFSTLGNNDYYFGKINENRIRIRDSHLLIGENKFPIDENYIATTTDITEIANYLLQVYQKGGNE